MSQEASLLLAYFLPCDSFTFEVYNFPSTLRWLVVLGIVVLLTSFRSEASILGSPLG